jgi:hypothetical protein
MFDSDRDRQLLASRKSRVGSVEARAVRERPIAVADAASGRYTRHAVDSPSAVWSRPDSGRGRRPNA